jgi:catabolite regulation protein CreA
MASIFEATAGKLVGPATGGTVTQADTSGKATGVTLNAASGQITMDDAELTAGAEVSFTVTNSLVAATDVVVVNHGSAGTAGAYLVQANTLAAGSFKITVSNVSAGALSEAIVLNFVALKGASS